MALRKKHRDAEVSTDSLNDIMFFLLLFFIILSTMVTPNAIKVALPDSKAKSTIDNNVKPIHLALTKDHKYFINGREVARDNLENELRAESSTKVDPTVIMHLDKELSIQDEIDVMTICYNLNCKTVLATAATKK